MIRVSSRLPVFGSANSFHTVVPLGTTQRPMLVLLICPPSGSRM
jgi:hypothetical protein